MRGCWVAGMGLLWSWVGDAALNLGQRGGFFEGQLGLKVGLVGFGVEGWSWGEVVGGLGRCGMVW